MAPALLVGVSPTATHPASHLLPQPSIAHAATAGQLASCGGTDVGGTVYREFNMNGTADLSPPSYRYAETGFPGMTVTVYDENGATLGSDTTETDGSWAVDVSGAAGSDVIVEFTVPAGFTAGPTGANNRTSVVHVAAGSCDVDFTAGDPSQHCEDNPKLATACFPASTGNDEATIVTLDYDDSYDFTFDQNSYPVPNYGNADSASENQLSQTKAVVATQGETAGISGLAWSPVTRKLYSGVYHKYGIDGNVGDMGKLYVTDPDTSTTSLWLDLNILFGAGVAGTLAGDATDRADVGYAGFTDVEISDDGSMLFVYNAFSREVFVIPINPNGSTSATAGDIKRFAIPEICSGTNSFGMPATAAGGLGYHDGLVYATATCTGPDVSDLNGRLFSFDPMTTPGAGVIQTEFDVDYSNWSLPYVLICGGFCGTYSGPASNYVAWLDPHQPEDFTPWLFDIEFDLDTSGNAALTLGTRNRGNETIDSFDPPDPTVNGFIHRACLVGGNWTLESSGACGTLTTGLDSANPSNTSDNIYQRGQPNATFYHGEGVEGPMMNGGLETIPGFNEVVGPATDNVYGDYDTGLSFHSVQDGLRTRDVNIIYGKGVGYSKGTSWGDIEALCEPAPLEIGNYLWFDVDGDGFQDPSEMPVVGATVGLYDASGNLLATTTTDADGEYYFNSKTTPGLTYNSNYTIGILDSNFAAGGVLENYDPTTADIGSDSLDSDGDTLATPVGTGADISTNGVAITTGGVGDSNHDYDFGFLEPVSIGSTVFYDLDNNGQQDGGESGIPGALVTLYEADGTTVVMTTTTDVNGDYFFGGLEEGDYIVGVAAPADAPTSSTDIGTTVGDNQTDGDDNGQQASPGDEAKSSVINLTLGGEPTGEAGQGGTQDGAGDSNGDMTIDFGFVPGVSIGSTVFYDMDDSGTQGPGEAGIPGVTVTLYESDGTTVVMTTTTDANGDYFFGGLDEGDYIVGVAAPADAPLSSTGAGGDDQTDGDDNGIQANPGDEALSSVINLTRNSEPTGESEQGGSQDSAYDSFGDMTVDFGFVPKVSVGSTVFYDQNNNGQQDGSESGIAGATVHLYEDADGDGTPDGPVISSTTTDANGDYYFGNLLEGQYIVGVEAPASAPHSSTDIATSGADNQTDGDDNGIQANPGDEAFSPTITLTVDGEPDDTTETAQGNLQENGDPTVDDNNGDMTVDFGFVAYDYGDLPDGNASGSPNYNTTSANGGPAHIITPGLYLGSVVDPEVDGQPSPTATGDDAAGTDDEDSVTFPPIVAGKPLTLSVTAVNTTSTDATVYGYIDFDGDGLFTGPGETVSAVVPAGTSSGSTDLVFNVPLNAAVGSTVGARLRLSTDGALGPDGPAPDGEVEDYLVPVSGYEYGDLPDQYGTLENGTVTTPAIHVTTNDLYFGSTVDHEGDGQPDVNAGMGTTGGDDNGGSDDEDGIVFMTPMMPGTTAVISMTAHVDPTINAGTGNEGIAFYGAWIDLDGDGTFSADEHFTGELVNGETVLNVPIPAGATISDTVYSRFRTSADFNEINDLSDHVGLAQSGEVEDYVLMSLGNTVFLDADGTATADDGAMGAGEAGIPGVTVELYRDGDTPGVDTPIATTTTGANGEYLFTGLAPDDYVVHLPANNFASGQPLEGLTSSSDSATSGNVDPDSDADDQAADENGVDNSDPSSNGISSQAITLEPGAEPTSDGNGSNSNLTVDFGLVYYDLSLVKSRSAGQGYAADFSSSPPTASFDIIIENQGPTTAYNVDVVDTIPAGMTLVNVDGAPIAPVTGTHTIMVPEIAAGDMVTVPVIMEIHDLSYGVYTNNAEVSGMENSSGTAVPDIDSTPDISPTNDLIDVSAGIDPSGDDDDNSHNNLDFGDTDGSAPGAIVDPATTGDEDDHDQEVIVGGLALGNRVWYDPNNNGVIDAGEMGIENVLVEVYAVDGAGNPVGAPVGTDTTDANGYWLVDNLPPGDYIAVIPASNFGAGNPLGDRVSSSDITSSGTPNNDTESDDNGVQQVAGGQVASGVITLDPAVGETQQGGNESDLESHGNAGDMFDNLTVDFGFTEYVSVGSTLFYDNNNDGQQGTGETGIPGILVELLDTTGTVVMTTTTDVNGDYLFDELMPGDYQVRVPTAPTDAPTSSTPTDMADNQEDGDDNGDQPGGVFSATTSPVITLIADDEPTAAETAQAGTQDDALDDANGDMTVDFGFVPPLSLGSTLFYDNDNNGIQDVGESGIPTITVELLDSTGAVIATTTTDSDGNYVFDNLLPGDYQVHIPTPPADAPMSSTTTNTNDDDVDGDDNGDQPGGFGTPTTSPVITLSVGDEPFSEPGQGGDLGTADDDDGNMTVDFGFVPPLSLGSTLFYDNDNDGIQSGADETGIAGITVELYDAAGNLVGTTTTDANGDYLFEELLPGDYQVVVPTPPADAPTSSTPTNMADDNVDGDDNGHQPGGAGTATASPMITLAVDTEPTGETEQGGSQDSNDDNNGDMTVDFGFAPYVSLGSTVFHDLNNDGQQGASDAGIPAITLELYDVAGSLVATTTTDSNGDYIFDELLPGDYQVVIPTPPITMPVSSQPTNLADDNMDEDDNGDQPGGAGTVTTSPVITLHADSEPVGEPGQGGMQDTADDSDGDMTVDFGFFEPVSVGDVVWYDNNDNGQQDGPQNGGLGEAGVAGVTVNLFDSAGNSVTDVNGNPVGPATTDSNGNYLFDELPPGEYYVEFDLSTLPGPQWYVGKQDESGVADDMDSDADPNSGQSGTTPFLNSGEEDITLDMGIVAPVRVGDRVWYDDNRDGIQDAGEAGVPNVLATLYDTATGQPVLDQFGVPMVDLTDANGDYIFENLPPGDYYVDFQLNTLPNGYVVTQPNQGSDDTVDSDADPSTGVTAPTGFLPSNTEDLTLDMGIYRPEGVRVGDKVWLDSDRDGIQDANEAGVPGVTVTLVDNGPGAGQGNPVTQDRDGNPITPQVTDSSGNYLFDNLPPGDYAVVFDLNTLPANHLVTSQDSGGDDLLDSDVDPNTGMTPSTGPLAEDEQDLSLDLGIYPAGNVVVGDTVWYDDNHNGVQDAGEAGVEGVTVNLFDSAGNSVTDMDGNPVGPTTTDVNGNYLFENLPAGDYYVEFDLSTLPGGYVPTIQDATNNQQPATSDQSDSDADPASGQTASTGFLNDGEEDLTLDMGIVAPVSVGDTVWFDNDNDGLQDSGEAGVPNVTVELFDASGDPVTDMAGNPMDPTMTDANGNYSFDNLPPGDYYVQFDLSTLPNGYVPTAPNMGGNDSNDSDANPSTGETPSTGFLPSGSSDPTLDMGIMQLAGVRVGDTVWYDDNINGLQDPGETGVAGVKVELFDAAGNPVTDMDGNPVGPTTTDANGNYLFDNLPAGDYYVQFDLATLPADSIVTLQDATSDQPSAISDQQDSDADPATGETASTGPLVAGEEDLTLDMGIYRPASIGDTVWEDLDADGVQDTGEPGIEGVTVTLYNADGSPATDMNGDPMTTTTDANGNYLFDDLYPGDYYVEFTPPAGYNPSPQDAGSGQPSAISDQQDSDADPVMGQTAVTTLTSGENDPTWDAGFYQPDPDAVRVGDKVWYDDDRDGVQDPDEAGVSGVTVELFDAAGNPVTDLNGNPVGPTTTDANGNYLFDNLPEGDYYVQFDLGTLPDDSIVTVQDATNDQQPATSDQSDSDADPITGQTASTGDLAAGEEDLTLDMGIYRPASIGDTVWLDADADGVQDAGEPGIEGVVVELFNADGSPATDVNGNPMTTTTYANGNYMFDDLYPGDYYVEFTPPAGYSPSPQDATNDQSPATSDQTDSDADPITGQTAVTTLSAGKNDPTWDAGFYLEDVPTPEPTPVPTGTPMPEVRVGDRVWYDNDGDGVQDAPTDEPGVEGVTVRLYNADGTLATDLAGNVVAPVMTDANGDYLFDNLPEGDYYVEFDLNTIPDGYQVTQQNSGGDDSADSDGDPNTGHTDTTGFLPAGSEDLTLDLGIVAPVAVGDRVWYDYDGDGTQDDPSDEPGVEGVTVVLLNADGTPAEDMLGNPVAPAITDSDGNYLFENLPPGDYQVLFDLDTLPENHMVTQPNAGGDDADSDGDPVTGLTDPTGMLMAGEEDLTLDLGILPIPPVEVGDTIWFDEDGDGIQDANETGVEGVTVLLFNEDGSPVTDLAGEPVGSTTTDENGNYLFENLPPGDYVVQFDLSTLPDGYEVTEQDAGSDDGSDSDGDPVSGMTAPTGFLPGGSQDLSLDLGITPEAPVQVGNYVWYDDDRDGIQDADETGVENVTVTLFKADGSPVTDMAGNPVGPTTTDSNGAYIFENLPAGDYYVQFDLGTLPQHYVVTEANAGNDDASDSDANTSTGETDTTDFLPAGSEDMTLDMGIVLIDPDVRVGDRVWLDNDKDGIQDTGEPGVEGVTVDLYDTSSGELVGTTVTDENGNYLFDELFPGDYYVQFDLDTIPDNYAVTEQNSGEDDALDSDVSPEDGLSAPTGILFTGEEDLSLDMGIYPLDKVTVGDTVWYDLDEDGIQDPNEPGVEGVTATLYETETGRPVADVLAQQTDSNGNYLFEDLPAGNYYVNFDLDTLPDGYGVTELNAIDDQSPATSDQTDSDANPANGSTGPTGPLSGNQADLSLDMGIVQLPGVTVGDYVWFDDNADGIQDPTEAGVPGVSVYIYDESTGQLVTDAAGEPLVQVTDGNGEYLFTDLPPGQYSVQFDLNTLPDDYVVSPSDQESSDTADSDAGADGKTPPTAILAHGDEDRTLDMGIYKTVSVGDTVWFDDGNGQQDGPQNGLDEEGVADVTVTLYEAETGEVVGTTTTDANGNYLFDDLPPGNYSVQFDLNSLPEGYVATHPNMGGDDGADSDADPTSGETPETGFLSSGEADLSLDMGIVQLVSVGDLVWFDEDRDGIQDVDETGVEGVSVTLYDAAGNPVAMTTTDSNGRYLFDGLLPGGYSVGFDLTTLPEGYVVTEPNLGDDDGADSDASPDTGLTESTGFLPSGSADLTLDMGIHTPVEELVRVGGQIWEDTDLDGEVDPNEQLMPGITVELYSQDNPETPIATAVTDENGNYLFEDLPPGEYFTALDPASLPPDALSPSYYSAGTLDDLRANSGLLEEGDEALEQDMALFFPASLSGLAWLDADGDGIRSVDEELLGGITVELYDATGEKVGEMQTNPDGTYLFENLIPGEYRVNYVTDGSYGISPNLQGEDDSRNSDIDPAINQSSTLFVGSGQHLPHIDLGLAELGSITNLIWVDTNGDGLQDADEEGIAGVTVFLYNAAGEVVAETVTDSEGRYSFGGLVADEYNVAFKAPDDLVLVTDVEAGELVRGPMISVDGSQNVSAVDIGFTQPAALGNYVWLDTNKDGLVDPDEAGVANTIVRLLDADGNLLEVTKTDSDGRFEFLVAPGDYQLQFIPKDGMDFTVQNQGDDSKDSDVDPKTGRTRVISIGVGQTDFSHFAGLVVSPTAIQLMSMTATETDAGVLVEWITGVEIDTFGFQLLRSRTGELATAVTVTEDMILALGDNGVYTFMDATARPGNVYSYWLSETEVDEQVNLYGPTQIIVENVSVLRTADEFRLFLPLIQN